MHETGHQAAALLGLVESLRPEIQRAGRGVPREQRIAWQLWERWISEIIADLFAIARVGVASTMGLIGLVSLPSAFVFRIALDDPHPFAWIRVHLSCAFGDALYPDPQWRQLVRVWTSLYPVSRLPADRVRVLRALLATTPAFVRLVLEHRPAGLHGHAVGEAFRTADRTPDRLARLYARWTADPSAIRRTRPALAFAVIGQARARGLLTPEAEDRLLGRLISHWALESTLLANAQLAAAPPRGPRERVPAARGGRPPPRPAARQPIALPRTRAGRIQEYQR